MTSQPLRSYSPLRDPREPVVHELESLRVDGRTVAVQVSMRRVDDGMWRGQFRFVEPGTERACETAEILRGRTEDELWQSVHGLGAHHLRDLYRALA